MPEVMLWSRLRSGKTGLKFRRQHPIGPYVADFYCRAGSLVVEIDGFTHDAGDSPQRDALRDNFMKENGYRVYRVAAAKVLRDTDEVAASIVAFAASPLHQPAAGPPPRAGED